MPCLVSRLACSREEHYVPGALLSSPDFKSSVRSRDALAYALCLSLRTTCVRRLDALSGALRHARERETHTLRSEEHTSELQSLMRLSYAVFCLKKKKTKHKKK